MTESPKRDCFNRISKHPFSGAIFDIFFWGGGRGLQKHTWLINQVGRNPCLTREIHASRPTAQNWKFVTWSYESTTLDMPKIYRRNRGFWLEKTFELKGFKSRPKTTKDAWKWKHTRHNNSSKVWIACIQQRIKNTKTFQQKEIHWTQSKY